LILPFDRAAVAVFKSFPSKVVQRAGVEDACIAAIALANNATVLTENLRDFQIIPGLSVDRW
jgi:predicted nucleic acid-binding protein